MTETYGYIVERKPGETYETIGTGERYQAVVRRVTTRASGWGEDRTVARFFGRTAACVRHAAERYCVREFGGVGTDPLGEEVI